MHTFTNFSGYYYTKALCYLTWWRRYMYTYVQKYGAATHKIIIWRVEFGAGQRTNEQTNKKK